MRPILAAILIALAPLPATAGAADTRRVLTGLMMTDCGIAASTERFRAELARIGAAAGPVLVEFLGEGAPAEIRRRTRADAVARYRRLARWARLHPDKPHARAFADVTCEAYVSAKLDRLDLTFRSNALRGLAIVKPARSAPAIRGATKRDPRLGRLCAQALQAMGEE